MELTVLELLSKIFSSFGFQGVLFIVLMMLIIKHSNKLFNISKYTLKKRQLRKNNTFQINTILQEMVTKLNSHKIAIFEFHNGGSNSSGLPFQHFSLTQLRGRLGIPEFNREYDNMHIASAIDFLEQLNENSLIEINGIKDIKSSFPILANSFKKQGVNYAIVISLEGVYDKIGFIVIAFKNKPENLGEEELEFITKEAHKITTLLDLKNFK